jgi:hypothetical protein
VLTFVWDLLTDGMDPVEDIDGHRGLSRQWMGRSGDANATVGRLGNGAKPYRSTGEVEGEFFELLWFVVKDELVSIDGKARGIPIQQFVHERFGETLGPVQTFEKRLAELLFDVREDISGGDGQGKELSLSRENSLSRQAMEVWIPIGGKGAKGLDGAHQAGPYVLAVEKLLETLEDALVGGLREKRKQGAFAFEKATEHFGNGKRIMPMRHRLQDLFLQLFCEQDGALGLARWTEISCMARKSEQMLRMA